MTRWRRFLLWQRQVADNRAFLACVPCFLAEFLADEVSVAVLVGAVLVGPDDEIEVLAILACVKVVFENAGDIDLEFYGACHGAVCLVRCCECFLPCKSPPPPAIPCAAAMLDHAMLGEGEQMAQRPGLRGEAEFYLDLAGGWQAVFLGVEGD